MATYKEIQKDIWQRCQINVKTCWIADIKRQHGKTMRIAHNRLNSQKVKHPCPQDKREFIEESLKRFGDL